MKEIRAKEILEFVSDFAIRAEKVERFVGNPYVKGDNVAEHLSRLQRLLVCIAPYLKKEFPEEKDLVEQISTILTLHDDDEIIVGYDVITQIKNHDTRNDEEIEDFKKAISRLSERSQKFMIPAFNAFRTKDSRAAKIAKAIDNVGGSQLVVEQKIGLINPSVAKFAIHYGDSVRGASEATDALVDAQIKQVIDYRKYLRTHPEEIESLVSSLQIPDPEELHRVARKAKELVEIDELTHEYNVEEALTPLDKLD